MIIIDAINFSFVYIFSGFIISLVLLYFLKNKHLSFILGYGLSPLLISLILYYLYLFFPNKNWFFYALIIHSFFLIILIIFYKQIYLISSNIKIISLKHLINSIKNLYFSKKILIVFILFITIFTLTRNIFYHTSYTDAFDYLKQGFVYSQDRSLDRLKTKEPFHKFKDGNQLYGPENDYTMNSAIRPGLPIFYSFFYRNNFPTSFSFTSIEFIYSYYFILLVFLFVYVLSRFKSKNILTGLVILLSCYFFTKLSYDNYKSIITAYYALAALFILYELSINKNWLYAFILGVLCGLMCYINYTGLVISSFIFLLGLIFLKSSLKKKIFIALLILFGFIFFSGNEIKGYKNFIFKKSFILHKNEQKNETKDLGAINNKAINNSMSSKVKYLETKSLETKPLKSESSKIKFLITKKLQAFTQLQFFGFIFWLFLIILILNFAKKRKLEDFTRLNLFFIILFFFFFSDPFFLNPHKYAHVLNISYKYTTILTIFVVIFIAMNYDLFLNIIGNIKVKYLQLIILSSVLLSEPIRNFSSNIILTILKEITTLDNPEEYYFNKINDFLLIFTLLSIVIYLILFFYQSRITRKNFPHIINSVFLIIFFILPCIFLINNNQDVINTFKYSFDKNIPHKYEEVKKNPKEKKSFIFINYINNNIDVDSKIIINTIPFGSSRYNFWFYTKNNKRLLQQKSAKFPNNIASDEFYFITNNKMRRGIKQNCTEQKNYYDIFLLKCHQPV